MGTPEPFSAYFEDSAYQTTLEGFEMRELKDQLCTLLITFQDDQDPVSTTRNNKFWAGTEIEGIVLLFHFLGRATDGLRRLRAAQHGNKRPAGSSESCKQVFRTVGLLTVTLANFMGKNAASLKIPKIMLILLISSNFADQRNHGGTHICQHPSPGLSPTSASCPFSAHRSVGEFTGGLITSNRSPPSSS